MDTPSPEFSACVKALSGAFALSSKALQYELAVSLYVFHLLGGTSLEARRELRQVYSDAGRQCLTHEDPAYQTVMRRIARSAALYDKLSPRKITKAIGNASGASAIRALIDLLAPLGLHTMDQVGIYAGHVIAPQGIRESPSATPPITPQRRTEDAAEVTHVKTKHIDVAVPPGTPARELMALAQKLIQLAEELSRT